MVEARIQKRHPQLLDETGMRARSDLGPSDPERSEIPSDGAVGAGPRRVRREQDDDVDVVKGERLHGTSDGSGGLGHLRALELGEQQRRVRNDRAGDYGQELHPAAAPIIGNDIDRGASARGPSISVPSR